MQDQFKAGLKWLAQHSPVEFEKALTDLVMFGTAGIMAKPDGTFAYVPMLKVMRMEKELINAQRAN